MCLSGCAFEDLMVTRRSCQIRSLRAPTASEPSTLGANQRASSIGSDHAR